MVMAAVAEDLRETVIELHALVLAASEVAERLRPAAAVEQVQALIWLAEKSADNAMLLMRV